LLVPLVVALDALVKDGHGLVRGTNLNGIPFLSYNISFVVYTVFSDGDLWYIPMLYTSLSEINDAHPTSLSADPDKKDDSTGVRKL